MQQIDLGEIKMNINMSSILVIILFFSCFICIIKGSWQLFSESFTVLFYLLIGFIFGSNQWLMRNILQSKILLKFVGIKLILALIGFILLCISIAEIYYCTQPDTANSLKFSFRFFSSLTLILTGLIFGIVSNSYSLCRNKINRISKRNIQINELEKPINTIN
jgi:hypothetical protein